MKYFGNAFNLEMIIAATTAVEEVKRAMRDSAIERATQRKEGIKAGLDLALYMEKSKRYIFVGDFFIIPNRAEKVANYAPRVRQRVERLARLNKMDLAPDDQVVEVWITNKDTDNLVDHGIHVHSLTSDDEWIRPTCGLLPLKLIKSVKEGESVDILMPCIRNKLLICRLTAAQRKYRYKNFGSFEDALLVAAGW